MRRLARAVVAAGLVATVLVSGAGALRFSDESYLTPTGVVGTPYTHRFTGPPPDQEGRGCDPPYTFLVDSGSLPPGLSLSSDGLVSGTPIQAGSYSFYVSMHDDPTDKPWCNPASAEREFTITVIGRLVIGPESVGPGTVGVPYSVAMTATLSEPKAWSISAGALPPGLTLDATSGVIAGTPTSAGSFPFTVRAVVDELRSDTKALTIVVRDPLVVTGSRPFDPRKHLARTEVGIRFAAALSATGGSGTYAWSLSGGGLPPGVALAPNGRLAGRAGGAGTYRFTVSVADGEGRSAVFDGAISVAPRLEIVTRRLRPGSVGRFYRAKLVARGGVPPTRWSAAGWFVQGLRFDSTHGLLVGTPRDPAVYRFTVEATDALGVTRTRALTLVVRR